MSEQSELASLTPWNSIKPRIIIGVSIERHSKGTNWSVRVDGAESIEDAIAVADKMRNEMEHRFGTQGA